MSGGNSARVVLLFKAGNEVPGMKRKGWQGGLSLVELIVALTLLSGVLLMTVTVRFNFQGLVNMGMNQAILFLNTHLALDRIVSAIQHANYLEIDAPNSTLTLSRKVGEDYISSRYYRDSGGNLCYQPDLSASPLPSPEIVLPSVTGFQLTGFPEGGERFQMARVRLEAKDPQGIARRDALFQTAAFCRIFHGSYKPVRVVTRDSSGNVTTVKGSYDTIQEAIDAETTENGDVVQVSSRKDPYDGVVISKAKSLTFEGGYDSVDWNRHYKDPDNPGQIDEAYKTIVKTVSRENGARFVAFYHATEVGRIAKLVIDGFSVQGEGNGWRGGIYIFQMPYGTLHITNNKLSGLDTSIFVGSSGEESVSTVIEGNIISRPSNEVAHSHSIGPIGFSGIYGRLEITRNIIENVAVKCLGINGINGWCAPNSKVSIHNNTIRNFQLTLYNSTGSYLHGDTYYGINVVKIIGGKAAFGAEVIIANNNIIDSFAIVNPDYFKGKKDVVRKPYDGMTFVGDYDLKISNNLVKVVTLNGVSAPSTNLLMQNNEFAGGGTVSVGGTAPARVYNNVFRDVLLNFGTKPSGDIVKNNSFYGSGIFQGGVKGYQVSTIQNNYFRDSHGDYRGSVAVLVTRGGTTLTNNIFYGSRYGVKVENAASASIINNTMYDTPIPVKVEGSSSLRFINNIMMEFSGTRPLYGNPYKVYDKPTGNISHNAMAPLGEGYIGYIMENIGFVGTNGLPGSSFLPNDFKLANGSPCIDAGKPDAVYYDPYDKVKYPVPDPATTPALPPAQGTIRNDIGAYGGPHAGPIGFVMPTEDDPSTPLIREDVIGTY